MGKKVWIKADGNGIIATGHIRRCMTIAKELSDLGADTEFILADESSADLLKTLSEEDGVFYNARIMHSVFSDPKEDFPALGEMFREEKPDFFLIDSYFTDEEYFGILNAAIKENSPSTKTGYIDDLCKFDYPVDIVINYDLIVDEKFYSAPVKLLGGEYAPLRKQFDNIEFRVNDLAERAFISTGGTDPYHVIGKMLDTVYESNLPNDKFINPLSHVSCDVIVGALFEDEYKRKLSELAEKHPDKITLHEYVTDMSELMKKADFAVTAGGTTLYELCAIGVPTIVFSMADNQKDFVKGFDTAGAAKYAGDARSDKKLIRKILAWGAASIDNSSFRQKMSDAARSIVGRDGAKKISEAILELK
ncbi:MAG: UDP-2,4-diacetamido-2,4,6-trideoxy-beta-L-altropyranose hydrolase [Butyrivibrio sp.]|nr:UDP-2,4-diacetamido-2,4,6-trideoxy-beta-L-altropyranose hydrolase [Butyrivibrio sp.]